jgi:predicted lipoprotein with Yx(FWY)xxD motif
MRVRMGLVAVPMLLLGLVACSGGDNEPQSVNQQQEVEVPSAVKVAQSNVGPILVDQSGRALYGFTKDENKSAACDADCIAAWPPLTSTSTVAAGDGAQAAILTMSDEKQAVYGKWKLYYYVGDAVEGDTNGQALDDEWFLVAPDGSLVKKTA